jgi:hypothetical protein
MADNDSKNNASTPGWNDWATRTTAVLAVIAALSSGRWGASNLQAILEQGKVNDTWSFYQAKSIKEHGLESTRDLAKALSANETGDRADALAALSRRADAQATLEAADKAKQMKAAGEFQTRRDTMVERGFWFEISFAALQLGVVLCTVATAAKTKWLWLSSIAIGLLGLVVLINGFGLYFRAPHAWYGGTSEDMSYNGQAPETK